MRYKVGDKVKIREWDDMKEEFGIDRNGNIVAYEEWHAVDDFGLSYITNRMRRYCGKETKIERIIYYKAGYRLEIDRCVGFWPECALLPIEKPQKENPDAQKKYKETTPYENATYFVRAVERYVNTEKFPQVDVILAILGIEKVEEE